MEKSGSSVKSISGIIAVGKCPLPYYLKLLSVIKPTRHMVINMYSTSALKIMASQRSLTIVTGFVTAENLCSMITMITNTQI